MSLHIDTHPLLMDVTDYNSTFGKQEEALEAWESAHPESGEHSSAVRAAPPCSCLVETALI